METGTLETRQVSNLGMFFSFIFNTLLSPSLNREVFFFSQFTRQLARMACHVTTLPRKRRTTTMTPTRQNGGSHTSSTQLPPTPTPIPPRTVNDASIRRTNSGSRRRWKQQGRIERNRGRGIRNIVLLRGRLSDIRMSLTQWFVRQ